MRVVKQNFRKKMSKEICLKRRHNSILKELRFFKFSKEPSVYRKKVHDDLLVVAIYVDDLFITGTSVNVISEFKREMALKFEMTTWVS